MTPRAVWLRLGGLVQGVGFRPWLGRLADRWAVAGWVRNTAGGAEVWVEGEAGAVAGFLVDATRPPAGGRVELADVCESEPQGCRAFRILPSEPGADLGVRVPPDRGLCSECRDEVRTPGDRRYRYPFTTCAACGPRFTVIESLPYDRDRLSLRRFPPCPRCASEDARPADRRYHVEGIVCAGCGPRVGLCDAAGRAVAEGDAAVRAAVDLLRRERVVALKGVGGFQLLVRADCPAPVARLRAAKARGTKPFAVMVPGPGWLDARACGTERERELLRSPENPIVLIVTSPDRLGVAAGVAPGLATVGVLLPTTPLHLLLLDELGVPVVTTSGNRGDEPIVTDTDAAVRELGAVADAFLTHDRPIVRRADDSVARVIDGVPVTFRLARGYAPLPLPALERFPGLPPVLAVGGHQKNAVALWTGRQAVLGAHVGDLDGESARRAFADSVTDLFRLYGATPAVVACDLHPTYATTVWAEAAGLPVERVQHHHAHAAAVLVEHDRVGDEVLALTWDGTGYGTDGTVWGGEALLARAAGYERVASLWPFPLPGGEAAVREPRRAAFGLMAVVMGLDAVVSDVALLNRLGVTVDEARGFARMIARGVNTPWTSSLGRLFDGVAALLLGVGRAGSEGEAAMRLEAAADDADADPIDVPLVRPGPGDWLVGDRSILRGDWRALVESLWRDAQTSDRPDVFAARFHDSVARWGAAVAALAPGRPVALGGGCFQNKRLRERLARELRRAGRTVLAASQIPPGDGGLAAGQLAVALSRLAGRH